MPLVLQASDIPSEDIWHPHLSDTLDKHMSHARLLILYGPRGIGKKTALHRWFNQNKTKFTVPWRALSDQETFVHESSRWKNGSPLTDQAVILLSEKLLVPENTKIISQWLQHPSCRDQFVLCTAFDDLIPEDWRLSGSWIFVPPVSQQNCQHFFQTRGIPRWISDVCWGMPGCALDLPETWYLEAEAPFLRAAVPLRLDEKVWPFAELWLLKHFFKQKKSAGWIETHRLFRELRLGYISEALFFEMFWMISNK